MDLEQQKKEDIELFQLKNHLAGLVRDYNMRMYYLRKARGKKFAYQQKERGLQLFETDLDKVL